jgi:hypothetical protein
MRVKLTYTTEVEGVLSEAANLLGNFETKLSVAVDLFNASIENLRSDTFNSGQLHHDLGVLKHNMGELDIRLMEVIQIVDGYEQYEREQRFSPPGIPDESVLPGAPEVIEPEEERDDY